MTAIFSVLALAAAGALSAPQLDHALSSAIIREYPSWATRDELSAAATLSIWVNADGRIYDCKTLSTVGDRRLALQICDLLMRKRTVPAQHSSGAAVIGNIVTMIKLTLPETRLGDQVAETVQSPELTVETGVLPGGLTSPYRMGLALEVAADGSITSCTGNKKADPALAALACEKAQGMSFERGADTKGNPVSYVRSLSVEVVAASAT